MATTFITKITDKVHRIYISKQAWHLEDLEIGDYVEVTIKKYKKAN
jgi:hypothetical protein